jgi:hypothetical protein
MSTAEMFVGLFSFLGLLLFSRLLAYGVRGIKGKRIAIGPTRRVLTGESAVVAGVFYCFLGTVIFMLCLRAFGPFFRDSMTTLFGPTQTGRSRAEIFVGLFSILGLILGPYMFQYGLRAGIQNKRIVVDHQGRVAEGGKAVGYGVFYCLLGFAMFVIFLRPFGEAFRDLVAFLFR